jgi:hypothetical protein|nr:hypothetical protein [Neorhizobium tomejilense]
MGYDKRISVVEYAFEGSRQAEPAEFVSKASLYVGGRANSEWALAARKALRRRQERDF